MSKEDDFKQRFVALMQNLRTAGMTDPEAVWLIGNLAAKFVDRTRSRTWAQFRKSRTPRAFSTLLKDFEAQGNSFHTQGKQRQAYAVQVLAMSLVAGTQKDPEIVSGTVLLDELVDRTVDYYRKNLKERGPMN